MSIIKHGKCRLIYVKGAASGVCARGCPALCGSAILIQHQIAV